MCYLEETYHTPCGHWGPRQNREPCASAMHHGNLTNGCWNSKVDGVNRVAKQCRRCVYTHRIRLGPLQVDRGCNPDAGQVADLRVTGARWLLLFPQPFGLSGRQVLGREGGVSIPRVPNRARLTSRPLHYFVNPPLTTVLGWRWAV